MSAAFTVIVTKIKIAECLIYFALLKILYIITEYNCTAHGADLTYISLLVIFCIIVYVTNTNLKSWKEYMKNTWRKPNTKLNFACTICHIIMFSWEGFSISYGYRMAISLAANPIVFQCFRMRSRVASGVFWDVRLEGFLAQSGSGSVQERAGMSPVNRTKDTNKILERSACGIFI